MPPPASVMKLASAASSSVPLPNQISGAAVAGGAAAVVRDKKTGGNYSAAGDDDINDVAAMGGVNLAEEANVSINIINTFQVSPSSLVQPIPSLKFVGGLKKIDLDLREFGGRGRL